jgi:phosphatidylglycerol:prolipoprotein diacylglycerol transferase
LGCFMNGCCFGSPTTLPWAAHFPEYHSTGGAGVHPSQVYESTLNGFLYLALARLHKTKQFEGQIFATYLIAYGILRAFVEIFRGDYTSRYAGFLTQGQLLSIPLIIGGIVLYWFKSKAGKNSAATGK